MQARQEATQLWHRQQEDARIELQAYKTVVLQNLLLQLTEVPTKGWRAAAQAAKLVGLGVHIDLSA